MKYLMWLLKAAIFFTLFAFALNNQQDATCISSLAPVAQRRWCWSCWPPSRWAWWWACWAWCRAGGAIAQRPAHKPQPAPNGVAAATSTRPPAPPMDFDLSWILLGLPLAFVLGWLASRLDLRQLRIENRQAPKAYFKGLNYLLNEQQDQAIDAFIEAVQNDPDTSELHFALGNLFRRRGEYERAVRVHEHLLSRGDLSRPTATVPSMRWRWTSCKAGLLDRAEEALRKLEGHALRGRSPPGPAGHLRALARLGQAADTSRSGWSSRTRAASPAGWPTTCASRPQAHLAAQEPDRRVRLLRQAIADNPRTPPAHGAGRAAAPARRRTRPLQVLEGRGGPAAGLPLIASAAGAAGHHHRPDGPVMLALLQAHYEKAPSIDLLEAIVAWRSMQAGDDIAAGARLVPAPPGAQPLAGGGVALDRRREARARAVPPAGAARAGPCRQAADALPLRGLRVRGQGTSGNARAARPGTATRPAGSKNSEPLPPASSERGIHTARACRPRTGCH
jgi:tetratricopeptide (TPR) repeat protein